MQFVDKILFQINTEIEKLGIDDCMGIDSALHMMRFIQPLCDELRKYILAYQFADETEEISFFKEYKPEVLSKYLYYNKIYVIESKYPTGSDIAQREYLYKELDSLTFYFGRNLDFYQYYRSKSTYLDRYYFTRNQNDLRICTDSSHIDKDPLYSTGYDFKVAKIITNELLKIYLTNRLQELERIVQRKADNGQIVETILRWTGSKRALVELIYALEANGDFNKGTATLKEIAGYFENVFSIDIGDLYHSYLEMRSRKINRTRYLETLQKVCSEEWMKTIHDASFIFFSQVIIFLEINKPFSISINIEWFIVFIQSCHIEILLSINQAINISIKQDCRIAK